jgi:hypothetical protein
MIADATEALIATVSDATSTEAQIGAAMASFFQAVDGLPVNAVNDAMRKLSDHFNLDDGSRAAFLAVVCAALIERGYDPSTIAGPLIKRIRHLLESAAALADVCIDRMPKSEDKDNDPSEVFEEMRKQMASEMPAESAAWEALKRFWPPATAVFSASPELRFAALDLRDSAAKIEDFHEGGHWLRLMLSVLEKEPILVIELETRLGILASISGVVDNFQLNVLLMDGFPRAGFLSRRRVPRRVADVALGRGPQQSDDIVTCVWNLYTWEAIVPGLRLPDPGDFGSSACWIWNEGVPKDIPVFEDRRVILLGPPSYQRTWRSQRMFSRLPATLDIERRMTKDEVSGLLLRMVAAKSS